jgi:ankyrin repeat protein
MLCAFFGADQERLSKELRKAVKRGDVVRAKELLDAGADVNDKRLNLTTPLFLAEDSSMIKLLVDRGARIEEREDGGFGKTPLESAALCACEKPDRSDHWKLVVKTLRDCGAGYTVDAAIYLNDIDSIKARLADDDSWVRNNDSVGRTVPLRIAAENGRVEICKLLLEHKADPDAFDACSGLSIMRYAVKYPDIVQLLIENGANLRRRLTWRGAVTGITMADEASILHFAVAEGNAISVHLLLDAGVDPNAADQSGMTPLHIAAISQRRDKANRSAPEKVAVEYELIIKALLSHDASKSFRDRSGRTALDIAASGECPESILRLLAKE